MSDGERREPVMIKHAREVRVERPAGHDSRPMWLRAMEAAMRQLQKEDPQRYGSERGGTIGNSWNWMFALTGMPAVCLLVAGRPRAGTEDIPVVVELPAGTVIQRAGELALAGAMLLAFVHDGRSGHCIGLLGRDGDRVVYDDVWPGDSLLCLHQNAAGIDAQEHGADNWSVTAAELSRVLVGVLVCPPGMWADVCGDPVAIGFADLAGTDLWSFFGLREVSRDGGEVRVSPGGFTEDVALGFTLDARDRVRRAELLLRESWAVGGDWGINPFGLDIARSFAVTLVPEPDRQAAAGLLTAFDLGYLRDRHQDPSFQASPAGQLMLAYLGGIPDAEFVFTMSGLQLKRQQDWLILSVDTY